MLAYGSYCSPGHLMRMWLLQSCGWKWILAYVDDAVVYLGNIIQYI